MDSLAEHRATVLRLRRNWLLFALGLAPLLVGPLGVALTLWMDSGFGRALLGVASVLLTMLSPAVALWVLLASPGRVGVPAALRASASGVELDGQTVVPSSAIQGAFVIPDYSYALVRVARRGRGPVDLVVPTPEEGRAVLRALGLDASQVVASLRLRSLIDTGLRRLVGYLLLTVLVIGAPIAHSLTGSPAMAGVFAQLCLAVLLVWAILNILPARVDVGADGVLLSYFWRERFISYADMLHVNPQLEGEPYVALELESGRTVRLPTRRGWSEEQRRRETLMLAERIQEALEEARGGGHAQDAARLDRAGRPARAWVAHLRGLGAGANADHRTAPLAHERLWRLVEDPACAPATRAAAAVALASGDDPAARARLHDLAAATAAPRLRVALAAVAAAPVAPAATDDSAAADAEEAALAELLESLEPDAPAPRLAATPASPSTPGYPSGS